MPAKTNTSHANKIEEEKLEFGDHTMETTKKGLRRGVGLRVQNVGATGAKVFKFHKDNTQKTFKMVENKKTEKKQNNSQIIESLVNAIRSNNALPYKVQFAKQYEYFHEETLKPFSRVRITIQELNY